MGSIAKTGIGRKLARLFLNFIRAIGYFFGFSLVAIFSFGLLHSEEFEATSVKYSMPRREPVFERHGQYYLRAQYVALAGWFFIALIAYLITL